ncbi:hypothetical protein, partial [Enterobacter intestinihominis]
NQADAHHATVDVALLNLTKIGANGDRIRKPAAHGQIYMLTKNAKPLSLIQITEPTSIITESPMRANE